MLEVPLEFRVGPKNLLRGRYGLGIGKTTDQKTSMFEYLIKSQSIVRTTLSDSPNSYGDTPKRTREVVDLFVPAFLSIAIENHEMT